MLGIHDLYAIACAYPLFENVFSLFNRKFEYSLTNISASNLIHFFECVGMQIKTLNVTINEQIKTSFEVIKFLECIQEHCPNLKNLSIKRWSNLNFSKLTVLLNRLESLRLDECVYSEKTNEIINHRFMIKPWILAQPLLYTVEKSACLHDLKNVTSLKLHNCKGFQANNLLEFLSQNNHLNELSLFALKNLTANDSDRNLFDNIGQYLNDIEAISIDVNTTSQIQFIANLPKLRSLQLLDYSVYNDQIVDRLLRRLCDSNTIEELDLYHCNLGRSTYRVISQFPKLQTLKLRKNFWVTDQHLQSLNLMQSLKTVCCFDNIILSDDGVLSIVKMSPAITQLDISWCFQVTNRAVYDIQTLLHDNQNRPKLEILAGGRTKITASVFDVSD